MNNFNLHGMELGVASAATQIEGFETNTNWYDWYQKGKIKDNTSPDITTKHYELYKEDIKLMKKMGIKIARIGLEWARIEPKENEFSKEALDHYKDELILMNKAGIKPLVTIWHFSNPLWFEEKGGFLSKDAEEIFLRYVDKVVKELGDYVESWVTLNEPNVYSLNGYFSPDWPPGEVNMLKMFKVNNIFIRLHIKAYELIHSYYKDTKVGTSLHVRSFIAKDNKLINRLITKFVRHSFQTGLAKSMNTGISSFPYKGNKKGKYYDFIGLNYYARSEINGFNNGVKDNCPKNDLGWEIYPSGLDELVNEYYNLYKAPIYITENGTCNNNDTFRCKYLYDHFKVLSNLSMVERYYHWCFVDNWEWAEGMSAKFGIVNINYPDQKRTIKKSGKFYMELIKNNGVTEEMYKEYVKDETYNIY